MIISNLSYIIVFQCKLTLSSLFNNQCMTLLIFFLLRDRHHLLILSLILLIIVIFV